MTNPIPTLRSSPLYLAVALCLAACALSGCAMGPRAAHVERESIAVHMQRQFTTYEAAVLEIHAHQGLVVVRPGDTPSCRVDAEIVAVDDAEAQRLAAHLELTVDRTSPGVLRLALEPGPGLRLDDLHGCWEVRAPAEVLVRIVSVSADVAVRGNVGPVEVRTIDGRVRSVSGGGSIAWDSRIHGRGFLVATSGSPALARAGTADPSGPALD